VTEGKSEATRKKYKAMIEQIVSLSGENTLQLAKPTATHRTFATTKKTIALRSYLSLVSVICNRIPDIASTSVKVNGKLSATP
jgi:hypothetical protein